MAEKCNYCGGSHDTARPRVSAIEYYPDGAIKRLEFHGPAPLAIGMDWAKPSEPTAPGLPLYGPATSTAPSLFEPKRGPYPDRPYMKRHSSGVGWIGDGWKHSPHAARNTKNNQ